MIEYINGILDEAEPAWAVVDCQGVGYGLNISLNTFSDIQGKERVRLYVYEAIREDAYVLFGFSTKQERSLFVLLLSVSGVGGNTARTILSAFSPAELCTLIQEDNVKVLKTVKGLGPKTAQRIIVDLRDKIDALGITPSAGSVPEVEQQQKINKEVHDEAVEALKMLGYPPAPANKVVNAILKDDPTLKVEKVIKMALKML